MSTKLISFVLVLALASSSYGVFFQGDVCHDGHFLLGNWEMPGSHQDWAPTGDFDGWILTDFSTMIGHYGDWSTLDNDSLKITTASGWHQLIELRMPDPQRFGLGTSGLTIEEAFFANDQFEMDVHVEPWMNPCTGEPCVGTYAQIGLILNSDGIGWYELGNIGVDIATGGDYHMVINYAHLFDGDELNDEFGETYSYLEFVLFGNTDAECDQTWYIDHAILTPEPTTIALLGLGGLALIRKRR
jgi:hypothetical protein